MAVLGLPLLCRRAEDVFFETGVVEAGETEEADDDEAAWRSCSWRLEHPERRHRRPDACGERAPIMSARMPRLPLLLLESPSARNHQFQMLGFGSSVLGNCLAALLIKLAG